MSQEQPAELRIGKKAFLQSALILFCLMVLAGLLSRFIPSGSYETMLVDGRDVIVPGSFQYTEIPAYPVWRWFSAPLEVLWGPDALVISVIILFILLVGGSFAVLNHVGVLKALIARIILKMGGNKYRLLAVVVLCFMLFGALLGIFEEVVPLVPVMIALSYLLGWDALTGLGMSLLATAFGFSAAIANPFTIGVAQRLSGLPVFSGFAFRLLIFLVIYLLLCTFLIRHARKIEKDPTRSPVYAEDLTERLKYTLNEEDLAAQTLQKAVLWFAASLALIVLLIISTSFIEGLSDITLPLVGLLFLTGGLGAGLLGGMSIKKALASFSKGVVGIAPGILLILMAVSVKHIIAQAGVMDTILDYAARSIGGASPYGASLLVYLLVLCLNFFIGSASAKAFLVMPIIAPLADLVGVTRQAAVLAFAFGDGFSNVLYPTNPVLLIALGLTVVSYPKWFKWVIGLQLAVLALTTAFLLLAVACNYGPF